MNKITDEIHPMAVSKVHETVLNLLKDEKGKILDAACGQGFLSNELTKYGFEVFAADVNPSLFRVKGLKCKTIDLNKKLPYASSFFDIVVSIETIEHLHNPYYCLEEFCRVLKPKGILIISTPNILTTFSRILFLIKGRFAGFLDVDFEKSGHITPLPLWQLKQMLEKIGFDIETITYSRGWIPIIRLEIPFKNLLFGQIIIIKSKKKIRH